MWGRGAAKPQAALTPALSRVQEREEMLAGGSLCFKAGVVFQSRFGHEAVFGWTTSLDGWDFCGGLGGGGGGVFVCGVGGGQGAGESV